MKITVRGMTIAQRTKLERAFAELVLEWKQGGLSLHKFSRMLRLSRTIAKSYGVTAEHVRNNYLKLSERELESLRVAR